jgi:hypothetical protein
MLLRHTLAPLQHDAAVCLEQGVELTPHMLAFCTIYLSFVLFLFCFSELCAFHDELSFLFFCRFSVMFSNFCWGSLIQITWIDG